MSSEESSIDEGVESVELTKEIETKLRHLYSHWSSKFADLHSEAEEAVATHDASEAKIKAAMERRQSSFKIKP